MRRSATRQDVTVSYQPSNLISHFSRVRAGATIGMPHPATEALVSHLPGRLVAVALAILLLPRLQAYAWAPETGHPSITIVSPAPGAVISGSMVTVRVAVHHFRLVAPVLKNPPILGDDEGHIHYLIDGHADLRSGQDMSADLSHTWIGVTPGRHTIEAYLATSQHVQFPGTSPATVTITVAPEHRSHRRFAAHPVAGTFRNPSMGGAADMDHTILNRPALLAGLVTVLLGSALLAAARRSEQVI